MISIVSNCATWRKITVLIALFALVFGMIAYTLYQLSEVSGGHGILDFDLGYSEERVHEVFASYGEHGLILYGRIQFLDLFNPALYSLIAAATTYALWNGRGPDWLCLFPFLGGLGDYAENLTLFLLSRSYPDIPAGLVSISSSLSFLKNGLLLFGLLPLLFGFGLLGFKKLR